MKRIGNIAWKEWREIQAFLYIALFVFIGLPFIGELERTWHTNRPLEIQTGPFVILLGGLLAVLIAVGSTCRDFQGHLEDFWRSRPLGVSRWLAIKFVIGLMVTLGSCDLAWAVNVWTIRNDMSFINWWMMMAFCSLQWTAIYSLAFLSGCLIRKMANAAMIAIAAMLLVYFLPALLPGSIFATSGNEAEIGTAGFVGGMLAVAAVGFILALISARRDWQIQSGQKLMYGSVSTAILILLATIAFERGSNLPSLDTINIPQSYLDKFKGTPVEIGYDNGHWYLGSNDNGVFGHIRGEIHINDSSAQLGDTQKIENMLDWHAMRWPPQTPTVAYQTVFVWDKLDAKFPDPTDYHGQALLQVVPLGEDGFPSSPVAQPAIGQAEQISLWPTEYFQGSGHIYALGNRLYVYGPQVAIFDISNLLHPQLISQSPVQIVSFAHFTTNARGQVDESSKLQIELPQLPDLTAEQRFSALGSDPYPRSPFNEQDSTGYWWIRLEGDLLCAGNSNFIDAYRKIKLTDQYVQYQRFAEYKFTTMDQFLNGGFDRVHLKNGYLYFGTGSYQFQYLYSTISVFDVTGAWPLERIAHFSAEQAGGDFAVLDDGRMLVLGDSKLYLVGAPPAHK
jgi:hypothetical protein